MKTKSLKVAIQAMGQEDIMELVVITVASPLNSDFIKSNLI
jgi:hypothetical protein